MVLAPFHHSLQAWCCRRWLLRARWRRRKEPLDTIREAGPVPAACMILRHTAGPGRSSAGFLETRACPSSAVDVDPGIGTRGPAWPARRLHATHRPDRARKHSGMPAPRWLVICHKRQGRALKTLYQCTSGAAPTCANGGAHARDERKPRWKELRKAGASEVIPETGEAGMTSLACAVDTERPQLPGHALPATATYRRLSDAEGAVSRYT